MWVNTKASLLLYNTIYGTLMGNKRDFVLVSDHLLLQLTHSQVPPHFLLKHHQARVHQYQEQLMDRPTLNQQMITYFQSAETQFLMERKQSKIHY